MTCQLKGHAPRQRARPTLSRTIARQMDARQVLAGGGHVSETVLDFWRDDRKFPAVDQPSLFQPIKFTAESTRRNGVSRTDQKGLDTRTLIE